MNPGSDDAIAAGCTCPVMDNGRGRGYLGGVQVVKRKLTQLWFYKRRVEELEKSLVNLCRTIDRVEVTEGVDDLGQLAVGYDLTAQLLTARNDALGALWKGRVVE